MKKLHTPGPWQVLPAESEKDYLRIRGTVLGSRYKVANVHRQSFLAIGPELNDREESESFANAELIADAPELLQALAWMVQQFEGEGYWTHFEQFSKARDLIFKHTTK